MYTTDECVNEHDHDRLGRINRRAYTDAALRLSNEPHLWHVETVLLEHESGSDEPQRQDEERDARQQQAVHQNGQESSNQEESQ